MQLAPGEVLGYRLGTRKFRELCSMNRLKRYVISIKVFPILTLCTLQISGDVANAIERGMCVVALSNAEEFNCEHHVVPKRMLFAAARGAPFGQLGRRRFVARLGFLRQSQRFETCGLFANGASFGFIFAHRLSSILSAFFLLETFFCPLSGLI
jgi:hypothetical protein